MKTIAASLLLLLPLAAHAANPAIVPDDWSRDDTARQVVLAVTLAVDASQTLDIKNYPGSTLHETNRLLGPHPSDNRITYYFVAASALSYGVAAALPAGWPRRSFQYGVIALEVATILRNRRIGMKFSY